MPGREADDDARGRAASVECARQSCRFSELEHAHERVPFRGVTKLITLGSGAQREIEDFMQPRKGLCLSVTTDKTQRPEPVEFLAREK